MIMDHPELSLGPSLSSNSSSSESDVNHFCKKRKHAWDHEPYTLAQPGIVDLQISDPLPLDWEQCLDLQSGRMYYLNRKTLKKSWVRPREQKLDLELNISTFPSSQTTKATTIAADRSSYTDDDSENSSGGGGGGNMIAVACVNCHLLVMLMKSSPSCPNCKFMHSLLPPSTAAVATPTRLQTPARKMDAVKSLETLSLLH